MNADRRPLMAGNWKMYKTREATRGFFAAFLPQVTDVDDRDILICPPFTGLAEALSATAGSPVMVGAQTMHYAAEGAFTGEVAPPMLVELGVPYVILGHSERRQYFNENDADLAQKVRAALDAGLLPVLCVGETLEEREAGRTEQKVGGQLDADLAEITDAELARVAVAYEPIWAIGTGRRPRRSRRRRRSPLPARAWRRGSPRRSRRASSTAAASRRRTSTRSWRSPTSTACSSAAPAWTRTSSPASSASRRRDRRAAQGQPCDPSLSPVGRVMRPVVLAILDGWGAAAPGSGNAVELARTPVFDHLMATYPHGTLEASGRAVGLPGGQMGNSEVGHLNIGAGRVVYQDLTRISLAVEDGSFFENRVLHQAFVKAVGRRSTVHLMGLVSGGGVHSDLGHLKACLEMARREGAGDVVVHAFLDGRDTPPRSAQRYLAEVQTSMDDLGVGRYGTVGGRYYAMDRDTRWDRTKLAYDAMVYGEGEHAASAAEAVAAAYERGENDEFVHPTVIGDDPGTRRQGRRRLPLLQLPSGPRPAAHAGLLRPRF